MTEAAAELKALSKERAIIDRKVVDYSIQLLRPFYEKRRTAVAVIPRFWSIVVGETEPLRPYILFEDSLAFYALQDLWVDWNKENSQNFTISFTFNDNPHFEAQTLTKSFVWNEPEGTDGYYTSPKPTQIKWKSNKNIGNEHTRGGEESFFTWFAYTDTNNEEDRTDNTTIAQLLTDEVFPLAIDLYDSAQDEQDIAEEFDLSDD